MKLVQYLKALVDISFLYCAFGTTLALFYDVDYGLTPLLILPVIQFLGYLWRDKPHRYAAFAPALLLVFFIHGVVDCVLPGIALVYLYQAMKRQKYVYMPEDEVSRFQKQTCVLFACIAIGYVFEQGGIISLYTLPKMVLYLAGGNVFLRTIRADQATMESPVFLRFNLASLIAVMVVAVVLSTKQVFDAICSAMIYLYLNYVYPVLTAIIYAIVWVVNGIYQIFVWLFGQRTLEPNGELIDLSGLGEMGEGLGVGSVNVPQWLVWTSMTLGIGLVVLILVLVLRRMLEGDELKEHDDYITTTMETMVVLPKDKKGGSLMASPRDKLRRYYRQFMRHAIKQGVAIRPSTDTAQIEQRFGADEQTAILRDCYRHARYDFTRPVDKTHVAQAKAALKAIKEKTKAQQAKTPTPVGEVDQG